MKHIYKESIQTFPEHLLCSQLAGERQAKSTALDAHCQGHATELSNASRTLWGKGTELWGTRGSTTTMWAERLQKVQERGCFGSVWVWF